MNQAMHEFTETIQFFWEHYILYPISHFSFGDALDILFLTVLMYGIVLFFSERRAGKLAVGLIFITLIYAFSGLTGMRAVYELMSWVAPFFIILMRRSGGWSL